MNAGQFDRDGYIDETHEHSCPARYGVGDCDESPAEVWCEDCIEPSVR